MSPKSLTSLAIPALLAAVLGLRVFGAFEPARVVLVRSPVTVSNPSFEIELPPDSRARTLQAPIAIVARVDGPDARYTLELDGKAACAATGGGGARVDCAARHAFGAGAGNVRIIGPEGGWTLRYLELATHHGSSSGLFRVFVVPRDRQVPGVRATVVAASAVMFAALFLWPGLAVTRGRARGAHAAVSGVLILTLAIVLVAPWISPFKVVMAWHTWALCASVLAGPRAIGVARRLLARATPRVRRAAIAVIVAATAAAAGANLVTQAAATYYGGNISGLVQIARSRFDAHPSLRHRSDLRASLVLHHGTGYDAQFMYFAAFDPLLRSLSNPEEYRGFIDAPPYRYPRAGFVWLTKLVSFDDERRYAAAMVWLAVAGFAATAAALAAIAIQSGSTPLWGLAVFGIPGLWRSLLLAMPEPVSAALAAFAVLCLLHARMRLAAACFAAAVLVRETTALLLFVAIVCVWREGKPNAAATLMLALVPYAAWRLYVGWMLFPDWGAQGFFFNPRAYDYPIKPIVELFALGSPHADAAVARASYAFAGLLVLASGTAFALVRRRPHVATIAAALYAVMALALDRDIIWTHVSNLERTTYEVFLMIAIAGAVSSARSRRTRWSPAVVMVTCALYVLLLGHDAPFMRRALLGL